MGNLGTTGIQGSNESESRLILQGAELVITNHFTDIEPLYTSARGHAALYRAKRMGKWHVLKCLKAGHSGNPLYLGLLQKEFEISYNLSHPNIVQTIGFESVDGLGPCIVMEYIDGRTLRSVLDERKMTRDEARQVILQTCKALEYIHSRQIIHRDLKPENIMLTGNGGNVKLIDFGYSDTDSYAVLKQPAGTRRYAAPEQTVGQAADTRADIYAFGVIIGEINGALPHKWMRLGRISARCTKPDADRRYASAAEIGTALTPTHTAGKAAATAFAVTAVVAAAAFTILGGGNEATQTDHVSRLTPHTTRQTTHPTPDTIYIKQGEKPVWQMANATTKAINNFNKDKRLAALCKLAREKTLAMLQADERVLADSSVPLQERLDLEGGQFTKIEQAIKDETARIISRSSPAYPLYKTAALDAMRDTYKSFQREKYRLKTNNKKSILPMQEHHPEIESLKLAIEAKTGGRLATPADFSRLTALIERETGCHVGMTTVKRLWGYIENNNRLRDDTLSIFARFAGYADWNSFRAAVRDNAGTESAFLDGRQVSATDLAAGDLLEIGWPPDRYCMIRHMGGNRFVVEKAVNGKLRAGDVFSASLFCLGEPLYVTGLSRAGSRPASYVAGIRHGLTLIRMKNNRQEE